jgi:glutaredoxin-related protein
MIKVEVLFSEGCPHTPPTIERLHAISENHNLEMNLIKIDVDSFEKAKELNFLGSPTILVNGLDIDPQVKGSKFEGFT